MKKIKHITSAAARACLLAGIMAATASCEDFVTLSLSNGSLGAEEVFSSDATATSAMLGVYGKVNNITWSGLVEPMFFADELESTQASYGVYQDNTYDELWTSADNYLSNYYATIYIANTVIEGLAASSQVTDATKNQLAGEARFMRAYCHFILANLYGDVPLVTTSDVRISSMLPNTPADDIYKAMISDLRSAHDLVAAEYKGNDRTRVNKGACAAMLARVYLYRGEWFRADSVASEVIADANYELATDLDLVMKKGSPETIWQLWNENGYHSGAASLVPDNATTPQRVRSGLVSAFETGDNRKTAWIKQNADTYYYFDKYKNRTLTTGASAEYNVQLRLGEQYLIRAEARAHLGRITGANSAASDLDVIRGRAGLTGTVATTEAAMLAAVEQERRIELLSESYHRWFDLKRTDRAIPVLGALKQTWTDRAVLLPFPMNMLRANKNLTQNDGYGY